MLDKKVIDYNTAKQLYDEKKITFDGIEEVLSKYQNK